MFNLLTGVAIDPNELVATLISSFPSLVIILTGAYQSMKTVKKNVNEFPMKLSNFKKDFTNDFNALKTEVTTVIDQKVSMVVDKTVDKLESFDEKLNEFVDKFEERIDKMTLENTKLVKENQTFQKVVALIVTGKSSDLKAEIISLVAKELNMSEEALKKLPSDIMATLPQFKQDLRDYRQILGEISFEEIMRELGYERKE